MQRMLASSMSIPFGFTCPLWNLVTSHLAFSLPIGTSPFHCSLFSSQLLDCFKPGLLPGSSWTLIWASGIHSTFFFLICNLSLSPYSIPHNCYSKSPLLSWSPQIFPCLKNFYDMSFSPTSSGRQATLLAENASPILLFCSMLRGHNDSNSWLFGLCIHSTLEEVKWLADC